MSIGVLTRASVSALALLASATVAAAQYGPPEPIGQGGAPVATPHYSPYGNSRTYVAPMATSPYGRRVIVQPHRNQSHRKP